MDDEEAVRTLVVKILEQADYEVDSAVDGRDALNKIEAAPPDLVILDLMMPGMDGWEVLRHLKAGPPPVVVMLSAFADRAEALQAGAAECLAKPFNLTEILATCSTVLQWKLRS